MKNNSNTISTVWQTDSHQSEEKLAPTIISYMDHALSMARTAAENGEVPVAAVIVETQTGKIISAAANRTETDTDPTAHAEIIAIRSATAAVGTTRLPQCDMYVTLEPCPMCAAAIAFARIRRLYFGAFDPKSGGVDHGPCMFQQHTIHHAPEVYGGIREKDCVKLLQEFFKKCRNP